MEQSDGNFWTKDNRKLQIYLLLLLFMLVWLRLLFSDADASSY